MEAIDLFALAGGAILCLLSAEVVYRICCAPGEGRSNAEDRARAILDARLAQGEPLTDAYYDTVWLTDEECGRIALSYPLTYDHVRAMFRRKRG